MANHVTEWLGAYHDGELRGARLHQVEQHLSACAACQAELDEMRNLSALLQEAAPIGELIPTERFVSNLALSLPRQPEQSQPRDALAIGWWLIPVGLLGIWLFINIAFSLSSVATLVANTDLVSSNLTWLRGNSLQMEWFANALNLFGHQLGAPELETLAVLNNANVFIAQLAGSLIPQILLAVAYLGWLFSWWLRHQQQPASNSGSYSQS